jgi:hypothetical protein
VDELLDPFTVRPATPALPMSYRRGVIVAWDTATAANTVIVDGAQFTDLPILNTSEALLLRAGDVVGIVDVGTSWAILGRFTIPGTADAASALRILGSIPMVAATVDASESTSSVAFTDLATVGPTVTVDVPDSGNVLVLLTASLAYSGPNGIAMGYDVSGANTIAASVNQALLNQVASGATNLRATHAVLLQDLFPGSTTFTAKYVALGGTAQFASRSLAIVPF